jgi:hypothetical protein
MMTLVFVVLYYCPKPYLYFDFGLTVDVVVVVVAVVVVVVEFVLVDVVVHDLNGNVLDKIHLHTVVVY